MIGLILTIIIGFIIAFITLHSTSGVTLILRENIYPAVPLYYIAVGTYLIGLVIAWIIDIPGSIVTAFRMSGKDRTIKSGNKTIVDLQKTIRKLEIENSKLGGENHKSIIVNKSVGENSTPNFVHNFLHKLKSRDSK